MVSPYKFLHVWLMVMINLSKVDMSMARHFNVPVVRSVRSPGRTLKIYHAHVSQAQHDEYSMLSYSDITEHNNRGSIISRGDVPSLRDSVAASKPGGNSRQFLPDNSGQLPIDRIAARSGVPTAAEQGGLQDGGGPAAVLCAAAAHILLCVGMLSALAAT